MGGGRLGRAAGGAGPVGRWLRFRRRLVPAACPGTSRFGPGARNRYVTLLGNMPAERGGARFYRRGPGPRWGDADRRVTRAFQPTRGWCGAAADGCPGPETWRRLFA
jgi:hypothetical protein